MHLWRAHDILVAEPELTEPRAWILLRALAARAGSGEAVADPCGVRVDDSGALEEVELGQGWLDVYPEEDPPFLSSVQLGPSIERLLDLYLPLCVGRGSNDLVIGHVAQSLDGQIATSTGASCFISGQQDLVHTHRLRALFDAVLVGRATVACDDPQLTTRLVPGRNPTRVVVDPVMRAPIERKVFRDGAAPTLLLCTQRLQTEVCPWQEQVAIVEIESPGQFLPPAEILGALRTRGLRRVFVEGGGVTVSHFLQAGLLGRLHIAVSPLLLGQGRPGLVLPRINRLDQAVRPRVRRFSFGEDMLFDCEFQGG